VANESERNLLLLLLGFVASPVWFYFVIRSIIMLILCGGFSAEQQKRSVEDENGNLERVSMYGITLELYTDADTK
jgi:hypothetical protein